MEELYLIRAVVEVLMACIIKLMTAMSKESSMNVRHRNIHNSVALL